MPMKVALPSLILNLLNLRLTLNSYRAVLGRASQPVSGNQTISASISSLSDYEQL